MEYTLLEVGTLMIRVSAWCLIPFGLYRLLRSRSAAERHLLLIGTLAGAIALPIATAWVPTVGPGWLAPPSGESQRASEKGTVEATQLATGAPVRGAVSRTSPALKALGESAREKRTEATPTITRLRPNRSATPEIAFTAKRAKSSGVEATSHESGSIVATSTKARPSRSPKSPSKHTIDTSIYGATNAEPTKARASYAPLNSTPRSVGEGLLALWALGFSIAVALLLVRFFRLGRMLSRSRTIARAEVPELDELSTRVGLRRLPALYESSEITVPIAADPALGCPHRSVIVLPTNWTDWGESRRRIALLHELAHLKRRDGWSTLSTSLATAIYWWHPAVALLARWARREAERAADDIVLAHGESASSYADQLLLFARSLSPQPRLGVPLMNHRRSDLKRRVVAILDPSRRRRPLDRRLLLAGGVVTVLALAPIAGLRVIAESQASVGGESLIGAGVYGSAPAVPTVSIPQTVDVANDAAPAERSTPATRSRVEVSTGRTTATETRAAWNDDPIVAEPIMIAQNDSHHLAQRDHKKDHKKKGKNSEYEKAYELYRESRFSEAAVAFEAAANAGEKTATSYYNAACSAALADETESALSFLQRAIDAGWDDGPHLVEDSDLDSLRRNARFQAMIDAVYEASGKRRSPVDGYRLRSVTERYDYLVESESANGHAWYKTGTALLSLREMDRAQVALERAVDVLGSKADNALYNLACLHAISGDTTEANRALRRAIEQGYDDAEYMQKDRDLRSIRESAGFADAVQLANDLDLSRFRDWKKHGKHDWSDHEGDDHKSWTEYERGRWDEAIEFYRSWTAQNPEVGRGWHNLGWSLHHARRFDEAIGPFERAADAGYSPANSAYNVACGHAMTGSIDEAFRWLDVAIERGYDSPHHLENDDDLANLHSDPRFRRLVWELEDRHENRKH